MTGALFGSLLHAALPTSLAGLLALGAMAGCQAVTGLDEDRVVKPVPDGSGGRDGSGDGAGGEGGSAPPQSVHCTVETGRQASQGAYGNPALAFASNRYQLAWPYFGSNGVVWNSVDKDGRNPNDQDVMLLGEADNLSNSSVALIPYGDHLLLGTSRRNAAEGTNTPTLVEFDAATGDALATDTAPEFASGWSPDVASLVANDDASRVLMVLRPVGYLGGTHLRRFNQSLNSLGDASVIDTWDASAAWAEKLGRFGVFVLKDGMPRELWLHTFDTDGDIAGATQQCISRPDEFAEVSYLKYSIAAAASSDRFFVAWTQELTKGEQHVYLTSVDQLGQRPKGDAVRVSSTHLDESYGAPSLLFDGHHLVVTWRSEGHLYFRRFTTALEPYGDELEVTSALDAGDTAKPALTAGPPGVYGVAYPSSQTLGYFIFQRIVCDDP